MLHAKSVGGHELYSETISSAKLQMPFLLIPKTLCPGRRFRNLKQIDKFALQYETGLGCRGHGIGCH